MHVNSLSARRSLALLVVAALAVVACSDDGGASSTSTTAAPATTVADTVVPVTTVPATDPAPASDAPTTSAPAGAPVYPLTGLPITDEAAAQRPALVVKIDNNASARPQSGLNEADLVYEEIVEVGTRFAAVFQSQHADPVGPIRSGRTQDITLLGSLNKPLLAWSGGNKRVTDAINASDLVSLSNLNQHARKEGGFFRDSSRRAPHDLYAQTSKLWTLTPVFAGPPPQQFSYRADGAAPAGAPSDGATIDMDGDRAEWTWDAGSGTYLRKTDGRVHKDALTGEQVSTHNVVVLVVAYRASAADSRSPEAVTTGSGEVFVFTGGNLVHGTWTRGDRLDPFTLTADDGSVIELTPGRTFVELARTGQTTAS